MVIRGRGSREEASRGHRKDIQVDRVGGRVGDDGRQIERLIQDEREHRIGEGAGDRPGIAATVGEETVRSGTDASLTV